MDNREEFDVPSLRARLLALLGNNSKYYPKLIEARFPRILDRIVAQWGEPALDGYLNELMVPARGGRQGFAPEIAMEIFHLSNLHSSLHLTPAASGTGWTGVEDPECFRKALRADD